MLIYFDTSLQRQVLSVFHYALKPGGHLWLGQSESPGSLAKAFELVNKKHKIYSKIDGRKMELPWASYGNEFLKNLPKDGSPLVQERLQHADRIILQKYAPCGVVLSSNFEILQFRGRTAPYLEAPPGQPTTNLLKMAHPELASKLRTLLQSAKKKNASVRKENLPFGHEGEIKHINIEVTPVNPIDAEKDRQYLLLFEDGPGRVKEKSKTKTPDSTRTKDQGHATKDRYIDQLQEEIDSKEEYQRTLIEQFEASQEELTSANEELQATNEELQSTNEELETAQEELQSANEELTSMNEELQKRNAEITDAYESLSRGEDRFRLIIDSVKEYAIYMLDPDGCVASWNEGARRLKGHESNEIMGQHFSKFYLPEDIAQQKPQKELEQARIEGKIEDEGWRIRKDGTRFWANVIITKLEEPSGKHLGFVKVTRDLTEKRRAAEALRQTNEDLERMVKEHTKELEDAVRVRDEFLSIASHELKTPLTSLKLQLQISTRRLHKLETDSTVSNDLMKSLEIGVRQTNSLAKLIDDLLDVTRIQSGKMPLLLQEVDLSNLVNEVIARFSESLTAAGCSIKLDLKEGVLGQWDHGRLEQVVVNLVSNAIKYAPGRPINITTSSSGNKATFTVQDFGCGISKDQQTSIFERFTRVNIDKNVGGLGLALYIVNQIINSHHGSITVESEPGKGSTFTVTLPIGQVP